MSKEIARVAPEEVETLNLTEAVRVAEFAQSDMDSAWSQVQQIQQLKSEASFRGLRAGCALVSIKLLLPHGEFIPFCEKHFASIQHRQLSNYMRLAEQFCEDKQIEAGTAWEQMIKIDPATVVAITDTTRKALPAADAQAVVEGGFPQLVFGFLGGDSLNDVLRRYGIKQPSTGKKQKLLPPAKPLTHADKVRTYTEAWQARLVDLNEYGMRQKTWAVLNHDLCARIATTLEDLARAMRADIVKHSATKPQGRRK
jgi:hypothetical protein